MNGIHRGLLGLFAVAFLTLAWAAPEARAQGFSFGLSVPGVSIGVGQTLYGGYGWGYPVVAQPPVIVRPAPAVIVQRPMIVQTPVVVGPRYYYGPRPWVARRSIGPRFVYRGYYGYRW